MLFAVMGLLGIVHLLAFVDARTPLLVADTRASDPPRPQLAGDAGAPGPGRAPPASWGPADGRLILVARNPERVLEELDAGGRRQSRIAQRMHGAPFAVPLALTTRVSGAGAT